MSPVLSVTLNEIELTRTTFSSQENDDDVQVDSKKLSKIQIICGKNAENCMKKQEGNMLFVFM